VTDKIRISPVRLVTAEGEAVGIVATAEAHRLAVESGLDLVEVAPTSGRRSAASWITASSSTSRKRGGQRQLSNTGNGRRSSACDFRQHEQDKTGTLLNRYPALHDGAAVKGIGEAYSTGDMGPMTDDKLFRHRFSTATSVWILVAFLVVVSGCSREPRFDSRKDFTNFLERRWPIRDIEVYCKRIKGGPAKDATVDLWRKELDLDWWEGALYSGQKNGFDDIYWYARTKDKCVKQFALLVRKRNVLWIIEHADGDDLLKPHAPL
jgi:hypothetical protein